MFYSYFCESNRQVVEVMHGVDVRLKDWGELCRSAGIAPGKTPASAKVSRLMSNSMPFVPRLKGLDKDAPSHKLEL